MAPTTLSSHSTNPTSIQPCPFCILLCYRRRAIFQSTFVQVLQGEDHFCSSLPCSPQLPIDIESDQLRKGAKSKVQLSCTVFRAVLRSLALASECSRVPFLLTTLNLRFSSVSQHFQDSSIDNKRSERSTSLYLSSRPHSTRNTRSCIHVQRLSIATKSSSLSLLDLYFRTSIVLTEAVVNSALRNRLSRHSGSSPS